MCNYVNVTVEYAEFNWSARFNILAPENISVGNYKGLEACAILDKILISKEFSDKVVTYVSPSFSFKLLTDFLSKLKENYINDGLADMPTDFRAFVVEDQGLHCGGSIEWDSHYDIVVDCNSAAKMPWTVYTLEYHVVSSLPVVFGYLDIVVIADEDWNIKYKVVTDNTDFDKQVLGDFRSYNDIESAKLEAEHLYEKYLKAWVANANSNHSEVVVLEHGEDGLKLQTTVGDLTVLNVSQDVSNTGRGVFTGHLAMPWSDRRVPFVARSVDKLTSLVSSLISRKVDHDLNLLIGKGVKG